jgi:cytidylate kinase
VSRQPAALNDMSECVVKTRSCEPENALLITIDGPAGSGKTTVSRLLAKRLNYQYVDTGALYRCIAFEVNRASIVPTDNKQLQQFCQDLSIVFRKINGKSRIFSNGRDITDLIRTPEVTTLASAVSAMPAVRQHLFDVQRKMGENKSVVFEGRDMGTVVFPEADVKFYLDAAIDIRAQRRHRELQAQHTQTIEAVQEDMKNRDHNDSHRELSPLKPAEDAFIIDTTHLSVEAVVEVMLDYILTSSC